MTEEVKDPRGDSIDIFLNGYIVKLPSKYLCYKYIIMLFLTLIRWAPYCGG